MGKTVMVSKFSEWKGLDRIGPIVHSMPSIFREISKDDFGIDGEIEIVVPKTKGKGFETTGGIIKVQSKSGASYIKQDSEQSFSTPIERNDLEAWVGANVPVILIVYHPGDDALYWKDIKFYVKSTPQVFQPPLRIIFDKSKDLFDETCYPTLCALAAISPPPISSLQKERLYSNLLLVKNSPRLLTQASTAYGHMREVREQLRGFVPPFCITGGQLYTLSDLRNPQCPLRLFCDTTTIRDLPTTRWIEEEQGANDYIFLLNQLLSAHLRRNGLHFQHDLHRHYFPRRDETSEEFKHEWLSVRTGHTGYRAVARHYHYGKESYWRHLAAKFSFKRFGSLLCLQILPKYFYTTDGQTPYDTTKVGPATTRIKAVEHNINVLNQVLFWADFLSERNPSIELRLDGRPSVVIEKEPLSGIAAFAIVNDLAIFDETELDAQPTLFDLSDGKNEDDDDFYA